ncbi:Predicted dithiol-disulfide isomerase, DsbA family [Corynebacterium pollutisoli]|uniref:Predicted dithiol-disulfide isomerase, DsbA family n=1 Tax=Corynebacterium pollutisoli TaxID=1610489 RepID=A0A1X7HYG2_9CORY|nr:DsbA family oxidoreductase [Corynebacterium pollutisoli]SMG07073.1 Predicted dithiol-disulfide isomerase, DsbA family [Corynebacterium pollutisoli]
MRIDIWSDYICPFCTVGERHLNLALESFAGRDDVEVVWRSFQLDPEAPKESTGNALDYLTRIKGMSEAQVVAMNDGLAARAAEVGLEFNWRDSHMVNTMDAHRLGVLAREDDKGIEWDELVKRAYFTEGKNIADHAQLRELAAEVGLAAQDVDSVLADETAYAREVAEDIALARQIGVQGVPFFVFDGRLAVSGAQPVEVFRQALEQVAAGK